MRLNGVQNGNSEVCWFSDVSATKKSLVISHLFQSFRWDLTNVSNFAQIVKVD